MATALFGWARSVASCNPQGLPNTQAWPDSRRYRKRIERFWRPHDGHRPLWIGLLSGFVEPSGTAKYSGLAGQSPLPEKDPRDFGGHTMATALFGWARSVASRDLLGLPDAQAWPDSRRYRKKIHTILEATRWPLPEKKPLLYRD